MNAAWSKWRSLTGVLCDKKIPERLKSWIYRAFVRPVATVFTELSAERRFSVMEAKMLRQTAGVARLNRGRNDSIRQRFGITRYLRKCAKLVCDGTATSFALEMIPSKILVLTPMCPVDGHEVDQNSGGLIPGMSGLTVIHYPLSGFGGLAYPFCCSLSGNFGPDNEQQIS
ncbi:unnamed protein product [Heligmosomoides polygyrus]|uniref:Dimer_Tnp_hAT domain-containing protein n=1 Tax=Heligmosomoides polygyrus TaxID=6339 RepID=A0A183GQF1_HELPZ|nr:unnamed protein product [Heligmosomoides polygyrus]